MGMHASVEERDGYLHISVTGSWDLPGGRRLIDFVARAAREHGVTRVLVDGRSTDSVPSDVDRYDMGRLVASELSGIRLALLYPAPKTNKLAENVAVNRGAMFRVLDDEEAAVGWLLEGA